DHFHRHFRLVWHPHARGTTVTAFHKDFPRVRLLDLPVTDLRLPIHMKQRILHPSPSANQRLHSMKRAQSADSDPSQQSTMATTRSVTDTLRAWKRNSACRSQCKKRMFESGLFASTTESVTAPSIRLDAIPSTTPPLASRRPIGNA